MGVTASSTAATAYDAIAARYDAVPVENRINRYMRAVSLERLRTTFHAGQLVLELGCGTGDEALALAAGGVRVLALDTSAEMVRISRAKAAVRGLADVATFRQAAASDLPALVDSLGGPFDGGYASFSLAYEADLRPVEAGLHALLRPGATFLASVPSRVCLVELFLALGSAHPAYAGRRLRPWHDHKVGGSLVPIRTYTPRALMRSMGRHFRLVGVEALPALVPPPYMNRAYARLDGLADAVERVDAALRTRSPFRYVGDHFLAELRHEPRHQDARPLPAGD